MHKIVVPIDGEGSDACPSFEQGFMCQFCEHFTAPDKYGIGTCEGFETNDWAYAQCGAFSCENFDRK
jgi:hypothetical protein